MRRTLVVTALVLVAGCDAGVVSSGGDGGEVTADSGRDAGLVSIDAGPIQDGGTGEPLVDAGTVTDAGGGVDAGLPVDGGSGGDAGVPRLRVTFRPTDAGFPDAERGFYQFVSELTAVQDAELRSAFSAGARLVFSLIRLDSVRSTAIGATRLSQLETGLGRIRSAGLKVIVRVAYNYPQNETQYQNAQDATLQQVRAHLQELAPVFSRNADVIAYFQAGFIGAWGEWHTSSNGLTTAANKLSVRDAWLAALPPNRTVSFRYPADLRAWYPTAPTVEARLSGAAPRVGFHNDCFMASPSDVGTYQGSTAQADRLLMQAFGQVAPFGGETCNPADDPNPMPRLGCAAVRTEGRAYGLTYLNADYWTTFHDSWRTGGCFDEVARSLGHRLQLDALEVDGRGAPGARVRVLVTVTNAGWARAHHERPLVLVLSQGAVSRALVVEGVDVRRVGAGEQRTLEGSVALPVDLGAGSWSLSLALPDPAPSLATDARYATRFANADDAAVGQRWEAQTARFATGATLQVP
ncbi:MAG: DUF4832 domain-containing protein [Myxococcaceae bacterium]|jgi:hypothetical protein|nr:DUF4832 domain-containing protein [Myxococcaceae bacterium]